MEEDIKCPKCNWAPNERTRWICSCGHLWNTFKTAGECPACGRIWTVTQCHVPSKGGCGRFSPHIDWYRNLDKQLQKDLENIFSVAPSVSE